MSDLERFYRAVLVAYPRSYRAQRGDEILDALLASSTPTAGPSAGETCSLLRHGLTLRFVGAVRPSGAWRLPAAAAVVCLSALLAVLSVVSGAELAGSLLSSLGSPQQDVWVDPLWPTYLLWLATFALVVSGRGLPAAATAWAGVLLHAATLGGLGPPDGRLMSSNLPGAFAQLALLVPGVVLAVLLLAPRRTRRAAGVISPRTAVAAMVAGAVPAIGDGMLGMGISQAWAFVFAAAVLLIALARAGLLLRAGLIIGFAFSYFLLIGLADGSGSRLPDGPVALAVTLALIPLAAAGPAVLLVRHVEARGFLWQAFVRALEALARRARGAAPDAPALDARTLNASMLNASTLDVPTRQRGAHTDSAREAAASED